MTATEQELFDNVREVKERVTRMESRLVQLGDHVGANLRTKQRIDVKVCSATGQTYVEIDSLDVSISRIATELQQAKVKPGDISIECQGVGVATLHLRSN